MRKPGSFMRKFLYIFLPLALVAGFIWSATSLYLSSRGLSSIKPTQRKCATMPATSTFAIYEGRWAPTPTPDDGTPRSEIIATPIVIDKVTDLAGEIDDREKTYVIVMHCDGSKEIFKVKATGNINQDVPLLADDVIYDWIPPASLMGSKPPMDLSTPILPAATLSPPGYPLPGLYFTQTP